MQISTGAQFVDLATAIGAGVHRDDLVMVEGSPTAVAALSARLGGPDAKRRDKRRQQKASRRRNR